MYEMQNLSKLTHLDQNTPEAMKAFWSFDKAVFAPPWKRRRLLACQSTPGAERDKSRPQDFPYSHFVN